MKGFLLLLAAVALAIFGGIIYTRVTAESPEQAQARHNLDVLAALEKTWAEHKARPAPDDPLDTTRFAALRSDVLAIETSAATEDVKAVQRQFLALVELGPKLFEKLKSGPRTDVPNNKTLQQRAADEWLVEVRNIGIRIEYELNDIQKKIDALKHTNKRILSGKPTP